MAEGDERIVATFDSYAGMLNAIRDRVNELQVTGTALDHYSGLPLGYFSKVAGANPIRRLGMTSFAPILNGLGLKCQFVEDQAATERLKKRVPPRNGSYARPTHTFVVVTDRKWAQIQKLGHQARRAVWDKVTPQQRSNMMRALTLKRWRGPCRAAGIISGGSSATKAANCRER